MGGSSISGLTVNKEDQDKNGEKYLHIEGGDIPKIKIYEQIDKIKIENKEDKEIKFCMKDPYAGSQECAKIFDYNDSGFSEEINGFSIVQGNECRSLVFRPGSVILEYIDTIEQFTYTGNLCKIEYRGPPITDQFYKQCCLCELDNTKTEVCNPLINNNYNTAHCNSFMVNYCKENPEETKCITWMEERTKKYDDTPLIMYSQLCTENHDKDYCTYMCLISRKYHDHFSKYCDNSLIKWCKNNESDDCSCVNSESRIDDEFEKYLGPKECWLTQCMMNKQKWKTTDQISIQNKCNILSCVIDIGKLNVKGDAIIELINNCMTGGLSSKSAFSNYIDFTDIKKEQTYGSLFHPFFIFIFLMTIVFFISYFYGHKTENIKDINDIDKIF